MNDAQDALKQAQDALSAAQQLQVDTINAVSDAQQILLNRGTTVNQKADALAVAQTAVDQAQANYDNKLISTTMDNAQPTIPGLQADIYTFNPQYYYPERSTTAHTFCKTITVDNINKDWGGDDIEGCGGDYVMIHYTGFITVPTTDDYTFLAQADDGWYMTIGDTVVNDNWVLKGCGGWWSQPITLEGGKSYPIDAWFYEYGGGACNQLIYQNSKTWDVAPVDWFSQNEQAPVIKTKDPELLALLEKAQSTLNDATTTYTLAQTELATAASELRSLQDKQLQNQVTIDTAQQSAQTKQEELNVAQQELAAIPPFKDTTPTPEKTTQPTEKPTTPVVQPTPDPITPTPTEPDQPKLPVDIATVNPQELTAAQVTELISVANEILNNSEQGSPVYEQALEALFVAAQADDIIVDPALAAIPGVSAAVDAINFLGNAGADMSPKVRAQSKKIVVTAVVAVGAAVNAATGAALMATPSAGGAPSGGSSSTGYRRRKD